MRLMFMVVLLVGFMPLRAQERTDPTKLKQDENLILVQAHCTSCHSEKLITQNRGDAEEWRRLIRWMQQTQGLWQIPKADEDKVVAYLAKNYPPNPQRRRKPLAPDLLPPVH